MALVPSDASDAAIDESDATRPTPAGGVSLLRLSVPMRLAIVAVAVCLLWLAVSWALR